MTSLRLAILAGLAAALASGGTFAADKEHSEAKAHAHGHGRANIAVEGNSLFIELEVPGVDIVGFEHVATTDAEKAAVIAASAALAKPADIVALPAAAGCKVTKVSAELHREGAHGEFHVTYQFACEAMAELDQIEFRYFGLFKRAEELEIAVITAKGARKFEATRKQPVVQLGSLL